MKICYWSIAWGEYRYMLQALVDSFHNVGLTDDFHVWTDGFLKGAASVQLIDPKTNLDQLQFFKFDFLEKEVRKLGDYDAFVFIDADHYFVRKPAVTPEQLLNGGPWHSFLESPVNAPTTTRRDWWDCPTERLVRLFRDNGCVQNEIRNSNGGYWVCHRDFIDDAARFAREFHEICKSAGHTFPEEVSVAYLTQLMNPDARPHYLERLNGYWASDWTDTFKNRMPVDEEWEMTYYMTGRKAKVRPALVHAMRSKAALKMAGVLSQTGRDKLSTIQLSPEDFQDEQGSGGVGGEKAGGGGAAPAACENKEAHKGACEGSAQSCRSRRAGAAKKASRHGAAAV